MTDPTQLTDEELEAMAEITPADIADAVAFWDEHAPEHDKGLIEAGPAGGDE